MASRTTRVRKPIYKHAGVIHAIQARFVDRHNCRKPSYDRFTCFMEKDEKSVGETVRKVSRRHLARFFPLIITTNVGAATGYTSI